MEIRPLHCAGGSNRASRVPPLAPEGRPWPEIQEPARSPLPLAHYHGGRLPAGSTTSAGVNTLCLPAPMSALTSHPPDPR